MCPGQRKCKFCKTIVGPDHQCFIQSYQCKNNSSEDSYDEQDEEMKMEKSSRFIFFDFESTQETGEHQVNFCVAQRGCDICMDLQTDKPFQLVVSFLEVEK